MAKLLVLALAFASLVAFATAHKTIITTTIKDDNQNSWWPPSRWTCNGQIKDGQWDVCQRYLDLSLQNPDESDPRSYELSILQEQCCDEFKNIDDDCYCKAVKQVFEDTLKKQGQKGSTQQTAQLRQEAQQLPNQCNLKLKDQCQIGSVIQTVITTVTEINSRQSSSRGSQQCSEVQGQQFNQCQRYIQQQQSGSVILMRINRQGQQQPQELRSCCNELENVQRECHCDAIQEVYEQALRQQQQQPQQGSKQSGQSSVEPQMMVQRAIQNLKNECNLQVQQCRIPSAVF